MTRKFFAGDILEQEDGSFYVHIWDISSDGVNPDHVLKLWDGEYAESVAEYINRTNTIPAL